MPRIDVTDEAIIDASPMVVYKAVFREYGGVTHWMMPYFEPKLKGDIPIDHEGAIFDVTLRYGGTAKFSAKLTKIVEPKSVEEEYEGDFVGTGKWIFEPTENGKTKVQFRVNLRTNRLLFSLVSPFVNMEKRHSDVMQKVFKALNSYLSKK